MNKLLFFCYEYVVLIDSNLMIDLADRFALHVLTVELKID